MEYITYILFILGIVATCLIWLRSSAPPLIRTVEPKISEKVSTGSPEKQTTMSSTATETTRVDVALNGKMPNVLTPWGWPGHNERVSDSNPATRNAQEVHGVSESLHRLVGHLLSEKQTVEDREYLLKKDASLRALLEDRYGRASVAPDAGYQELKAPLFPEPSEPLKMEILREIKTPWGW
jgi:hypothetical protein